MQMDVLVTRCGRTVDAVGPAWIDWEPRVPDRANLPRAPVVRLGWEQKRARIWLPAGALTTPCYLQLLELLNGIEPERVTIVHADGVRPIEIYADIDDLNARLDALRGEIAGETPRPGCLTHTLALARLKESRRRSLAGLYRRWKTLDGRLGAVRGPLGGGVGGHLLLGLEAGAVAVQAWPSQPEIAAASAGDCWDVARFQTIVEVGQARLELAEIIVPPGPDLGPPCRLRYERLVLPWRTATGGRLVSSTGLLRTIRACG